MSLRPLVLIFALMCGVGSSLLVGCGSNDSSKLIAATDSDKLVQHLEAVQNAVDLGKCQQADNALQQLNTDLGSLPTTVDSGLRKELRDGYSKLSRQANSECRQVAASTTATTQATTAATTTAETVPTTTADTEPTVPETTPTTTPTEPTTTEQNGGVPPEPTTTAVTPPPAGVSP